MHVKYNTNWETKLKEFAFPTFHVLWEEYVRGKKGFMQKNECQNETLRLF